MLRTLLGLMLAFVIIGPTFAHNGMTNFIPAWPDPTTFVLDGEEDDWGWYDTESFGVKPEQIESLLGEHLGQGANPNPEDFSASFFVAWSPPPDNALYFFARAQDDTLRALEEKGNWWNDDYLQLQIDADHAAGNYLSEFINGYRLGFHPLGGGGEAPPFDEAQGPLNWGGEEPYTFSASTILPAGSVTWATNVEYTFEVRTHLWDIYGVEGPQTSTPHVFEPEQIIHFNARFDDGDREANGEQDLWGQVGGSYECDREGDHCPDYLLVPTDMVDPYVSWEEGRATAVEHTTWGRIKSHIDR